MSKDGQQTVTIYIYEVIRVLPKAYWFILYNLIISIYNVLGWHSYTKQLRSLQQLQLMIGLKPRMVLMEAWMVCPVSSLALSFWLNELGHPKEWARWMLEMGSNWKEQEFKGNNLRTWFELLWYKYIYIYIMTDLLLVLVLIYVKCGMIAYSFFRKLDDLMQFQNTSKRVGA